MLWEHYVYRRGADAETLWERVHSGQKVNLLYIAGNGFDVRVKYVLNAYVRTLMAAGSQVESAKLLLVGFAGYELSDELTAITVENSKSLAEIFSPIGATENIVFGVPGPDEEQPNPNAALSLGLREVLRLLPSATDIVLDVSSLPRVVFLTLITGILAHLIPRKTDGALYAGGVNFHVLVAEDPALDALIRAEDLANELVYVPGYSSGVQAESFQDWPMVWFPVLGEGRTHQLEKIRRTLIDADTEICPVLPHPSSSANRADRLVVEYQDTLFGGADTPMSNILLVHERQPFEAYRQILQAMNRYRHSLASLGGCRLVISPLASKLITVGVGLACFEMQDISADAKHKVALPHAEPRRYAASRRDLEQAKPEIAALLLTGLAYQTSSPKAAVI